MKTDTTSTATPTRYSGLPIWTNGSARPVFDDDDRRFCRIIARNARFLPEDAAAVITFGLGRRGVTVYRGSYAYPLHVSTSRPMDWEFAEDLVDIAMVELSYSETEQAAQIADETDERYDVEIFFDRNGHWPWEAVAQNA
jgi:hypothetical protein